MQHQTCNQKEKKKRKRERGGVGDVWLGVNLVVGRGLKCVGLCGTCDGEGGCKMCGGERKGKRMRGVRK